MEQLQQNQKSKPFNLSARFFLAAAFFTAILAWQGCDDGKAAFIKRTSDTQRLLIEKLSHDSITFGSGFTGIEGGFFCLYKEKEKNKDNWSDWMDGQIDINGLPNVRPHKALNELFAKQGYQVTRDSGSLCYILFTERERYKVGFYEAMIGEAIQFEDIVSVIDLNEGKAYHLARKLGGPPPYTYDGKGLGEIPWTVEEEFDFLKKNAFPKTPNGCGFEMPGMLFTDSGFKYQVIRKGNGTILPTFTDRVNVHMRKLTLAGEAIDSSTQVLKPMYQLDGPLKELLKKMHVGDKIRAFNSATSLGENKDEKNVVELNIVLEIEVLKILQ